MGSSGLEPGTLSTNRSLRRRRSGQPSHEIAHLSSCWNQRKSKYWIIDDYHAAVITSKGVMGERVRVGGGLVGWRKGGGKDETESFTHSFAQLSPLHPPERVNQRRHEA